MGKKQARKGGRRTKVNRLQALKAEEHAALNFWRNQEKKNKPKQTCTKKKHQTAEAAATQGRRLNDPELSIYLCRTCGSWHVGHKRRKEK